MNRPEGWKGMPGGDWEDGVAVISLSERKDIFEAGADAMLEGLKNKDSKIPDGEGSYYQLTHWLKPERAKFKTAFIPGEK